MKHLRIELTDKETEELEIEDLSLNKLNKLFRFLIDPPEGVKRKQFHDQLEEEEYRRHKNSEVYVSRFCIAEEMDWGEDTASAYINALQKHPVHSDSISIYMAFLVSLKGDMKGRFWRVDKERIKKSLVKTTERHFFELSEQEEDFIAELVRELDWRPILLGETEGSTEYMLLDSFYNCMRSHKENGEQPIEGNEIAERLLKKFREDAFSRSPSE